MNEYKLSNRAKKCLNESEVLYYLKTEDVVSVVLINKKFASEEILLRNFVTSNTIHFEGIYTAKAKKTNKDYNWWKSNHKSFTKDKGLWWENQGYILTRDLEYS